MAATVGQLADLNAAIMFTKSMMAEFRQQNVDAGITPAQALWMHTRFKDWSFILNLVTYNVDIVNMAATGDVYGMYLAFTNGTADSMLLPYHWINSTRKDWLMNQTKAYLGLP